MLMTASQHWDEHQKVEGREGDLRPLGERLLRNKGTRLALCVYWRDDKR